MASNAETPPPTSSNPSSPIISTFTRANRSNTSSSISAASSRLRSASIKLLEADPPPGMWAATASATSSAPTISDIRRGSFGHRGWDGEAQRRGSLTGNSGTFRQKTDGTTEGNNLFPAVVEETGRPSFDERGRSVDGAGPLDDDIAPDAIAEPSSAAAVSKVQSTSTKEPAFATLTPRTPYEEPPKLPWKESTVIGLKGFWKWFITPMGFLITLYGLNVVAWGGMLFLLLCNAAPAMCHPTCNDLYSPRRIWLEIDSQILNALFCVTGFGLIPWRFRDLWFLLIWRLPFLNREKRHRGLRRLAGIHRGWFRLPGSDEEMNASILDEENPSLPLPLSKRLDEPLTGVRAPPTAGWKLDFVIWCNCWNTFLQVVLCGFMWGFSRFDRPSWATGLFIALGCIVAGVAGIMMYVEGKKIKKIEGVPPREQPGSRSSLESGRDGTGELVKTETQKHNEVIGEKANGIGS